MKFTSAVLLSVIASSGVNADVPSLTPDNWDSETAGKTVFIKFFAPWCGHCKKMAPDWEKLAGKWAGNDVGLIAEVDCTADGKPLCDANGVRGFPTIKYGDPSALEDYKGGRDFDSLSKFADDNLKPTCSPKNIDLCDDDKKKEIQKFQAMTEDELDKLIHEKSDALDKVESDFKEVVEVLQKTYQDAMEKKEKDLEEIKNSGLNLMKSVKASKQSGSGKDEL